MGFFGVYMIKSALYLVALFIPYILLYRNDTCFRFKRCVLLFLVGLSLVLPTVSITEWFREETTNTWNNVLITAPVAINISDSFEQIQTGYETNQWLWACLLIYILGIVACFTFKIIQFVKICRFISKGCLWVEKEDDITIYCHIATTEPFSWMKRIVISKTDYQKHGREILLHEKAHIRFYHSLDMFLISLLQIFQWFNPVIWLLTKEIKNIHEYQADAFVLKQGVDAKAYQLLLIEKASGFKSYTLANSFNESVIKKRIIMMSKKKTNPWAWVKCLYVVPVMAMALNVFAESPITTKLNELEQVKANTLLAPSYSQLKKVETDSLSSTSAKNKQINIVLGQEVGEESDSIYSTPQVLPTFPDGTRGLMLFLQQNIKYPKQAIQDSIQGRVICQFVIDKEGNVTQQRVVKSSSSELLDAEAIRVVSSMPKWIPGQHKGNPVRVRFTIPISFSIPEAPVKKVAEDEQTSER